MSVVVVGGLDTYLSSVVRALLAKGVPITCLLDRYQNPIKQDPLFQGVLDVDARQFLYPEQILCLNEGYEDDFSTDLLASFAHAESVFLSVSDRFSITLSVLERKRLFRELLHYFYRFLSRGLYSTIVFPNVPHGGWNNVLYFVAKRLNVRTLIIENTRINDRMIIWEDYEHDLLRIPDGFFPAVNEDELVKRIDSEVYLAALGVQESQVIRFSKDVSSQAQADSDWFSREIAFGRRLLGAILTRLQRWRSGVYTFDRRPMVLNYPQSEVLTVIRRRIVARRYRRLKRDYDALATASATAPYVLFCLNYQPEKTTTPMGGVFEDQILAVRTLAATLPEGWQVLVKEHPRQFGGVFDSGPFRDEHYYEQLAAIDRVALASRHLDTHSLIKRAQCTATIGGSVGWEGLLAGKPSLVFGVCWYSACQSCYRVTSSDSARHAFEVLVRKDTASVRRDVLRYLVFIQNHLTIGAINDRIAAYSSRSLQELVDGLADGIAARLRLPPRHATIEAPSHEQSIPT